MGTILKRPRARLELPRKRLFVAEMLLFASLFTWICLQSVTFFTMLAVGVYAVGCLAMLVLAPRGRFAYAADVVALFLSILLAYPAAAVEVRRRYRTSSTEVASVFAACAAYRSDHASWPPDLSGLVPQHLPELPADAWGHPIQYRCSRDGTAAFVGFARRCGDYRYQWTFDGVGWSSTWGAVQSTPPEPPFFIFHY